MPSLSSNQAQWVTLAFILITTVGIISYDVAAIRWHGVEASLSRVARRLFVNCPTLFVAVVFWLGVLVGHLGLNIKP